MKAGSNPHAQRAPSGRMPAPLMMALQGLVLVTVALLSPWPARTVAAHPLGNFTVNRYLRVQPTGSELRLYYVLDMAEIPTFQETAGLARDAHNVIDAEAAERYASAKAQEIARNLRLEVNGVDVPIAVRDRRIGFSEGQAGLPTLRLEALFAAELHGDSFNVTVRDLNEPQRLGWREIVAQAGPRLREPAHGHDHTHDHGAGSAAGWRGLVALGVSGGLLPCPSALILMLSAIALQRTGLGLVLTIAFSAGLAATLIAVGLLTVTVGRSLAGLPRRLALPAPIRTFAGFAPALSALVVLLAGLAITLESAVKLS